MVNILLLLAIVCACACLALFTASGMVADGPNWGSEVCATAPIALSQPAALSLSCCGIVWPLDLNKVCLSRSLIGTKLALEAHHPGPMNLSHCGN